MTETLRERLHAAIQASAATNDDLEGKVLLGWVIVAEWMDNEGARWLSRSGAPADPTRDLPDWQGDGYLHNALHDGWGCEDGDEDE